MSDDALDEVLLGKWADLKAAVAELDEDLSKSAKGVKAAGVRARRGLRTLKVKAADLVKYSVNKDKTKKPE